MAALPNHTVGLLIAAVVLTACAAKRPALYPNEHLSRVGAEAAERDIDECIDLAKQSGVDSDRAKKVAGTSAAGAATGAATGAVIGAITGGAGRGAAAGAAGGGTAGLFGGLFRSRDPDPVHKAFVEQCLRERGYNPIGWR